MSPNLIEPHIRCVIRSLGDDRVVTDRLVQMGILPGTRFEVLRAGPFGGTVEVALPHGELVALRKSELAAIDCDLVAMPLTSRAVHAGMRYRVESLEGGRSFTDRMQKQGIRAGAIVEVLRTAPPELTLRIDGHKVTLGHGEAAKVIVSKATDGTT